LFFFLFPIKIRESEITSRLFKYTKSDENFQARINFYEKQKKIVEARKRRAERSKNVETPDFVGGIKMLSMI